MKKHPKAALTAATIHLPLKVTNEALQEIASQALDMGASNHWTFGRTEVAAGADMKADYLGECLAYYEQQLVITHTHPKLGETGPDQTSVLTKAKLLAGLELYLQNGGSSSILALNFDDNAVDADDADTILQYALFQSIIFS